MNDQIFLLFEEKEIFLWDYSDILQLDLGCVAFLVLMYCIFILLMVVTSVGFIVILNSHCSHCLVGLNICVSFIFSSFETTCQSFFFLSFLTGLFVEALFKFIQVILGIASITRETSCVSSSSLDYDCFYLPNYFLRLAVLRFFSIIKHNEKLQKHEEGLFRY